MAESAPQIQYRNETIAGFEQNQALLRPFVTTEAVIKGNQAVILVADSGGNSAVTRGLNGLIPAVPDNLVQNTATLVEWHDLRKASDFNIFESQGDRTSIMQKSCRSVLNRRIDDDILGELANATNDTGAAVTGGIDLVVYAQTILGNNYVPFDGGITAVISPAFLGYLQKTREWGSADYVSSKPLEGNPAAWADVNGFYRWMGINFVVHPRLTGAGTNAEKCYMFHKNAIAHAAGIQELQATIGYDAEQAYSWARCSMYMGPKLLQNSGVVVMNHDGSAFAAQ